MKRWWSKHIDIRSKYIFTYTLFRDMIEPNLNTDIISRFLSNMDARPLPVQPCSVYWRIDDTHESVSSVLDAHFSRALDPYETTRKHDYAPGCRLSILKLAGRSSANDVIDGIRYSGASAWLAADGRCRPKRSAAGTRGGNEETVLGHPKWIVRAGSLGFWQCGLMISDRLLSQNSDLPSK